MHKNLKLLIDFTDWCENQLSRGRYHNPKDLNMLFEMIEQTIVVYNKDDANSHLDTEEKFIGIYQQYFEM